MGIEGIWGKNRGKHGVKVEGSKSEDRGKLGQGQREARSESRRKQKRGQKEAEAEVNRYERAIFIKNIARGMFGTIIFTNFELLNLR